MPTYPSTSATTFTGDICLTEGSGKVGICKGIPSKKLHLEKGAASCKLRLDTYSGSSYLTQYKSAGSTLTQTASGDELGTIDIYGVNDSSPAAFVKCAAISSTQVTASAGVTLAAKMSFQTSSGTGAAAERLTGVYATSNFNKVGIGTTSPYTTLDISPGTIGNNNPNIRLRGVLSFYPDGTYKANDGDLFVCEDNGSARLYVYMDAGLMSGWKYIDLT